MSPEVVFYEVFDEDSGNMLRQVRTLPELKTFLDCLDPAHAKGLRLFRHVGKVIDLVASDEQIFAMQVGPR